MTDSIAKKSPWRKPESHLDRWVTLLKDPKIKEEWDNLKKEKLKNATTEMHQLPESTLKENKDK
jgi:hypothetical protein